MPLTLCLFILEPFESFDHFVESDWVLRIIGCWSFGVKHNKYCGGGFAVTSNKTGAAPESPAIAGIVCSL
jgi:hypothetical protein